MTIHRVQKDGFISTLATGNTIEPALAAGNIQSDQDISYILRKDDDRSLDEKIL